MGLTLDVGCGKRPDGDVDCDLTIQKGVPNFVRCNAEYLPSREGSFDVVLSYYAIEHCLDLLRLLRELYTVSLSRVELLTDNALWYLYLHRKLRGQSACFDYERHYHIFFPKTCMRLLHMLGYDATVSAGNFVSNQKTPNVQKLFTNAPSAG
jgi:ubiquinone/menaquinone biosynthesis C-methylase UbiE